METLTTYVIPPFVGLVLGFVYFGGLWLTMRALPSSRQPALLMLASYFGRMAAAFAAILAVALMGGWRAVLTSLAGFLAIKVVLMWRLGPRRGGIKLYREVGDGNQP